MSTANDLSRMLPGFDFLQHLMKGASAGLPGVQGFGQWVAPTLDPAELDKRIQELKTVQFWLEQNARLLGTTVQALEVQRMTLATLQTMNLPMADLATALRARAPSPPAPPAAAPTDEQNPPPEATTGDAGPAAAPKAAAIDPMQWWGALTQQFAEIAARAVKDGGSAAAAAAPAPAATRARTAASKTGAGTARKSAARKAPARKRTA